MNRVKGQGTVQQINAFFKKLFKRYDAIKSHKKWIRTRSDITVHAGPHQCDDVPRTLAGWAASLNLHRTVGVVFSSGSVDRSDALIVTPSFMTDHSGFLRGLRPLLPPRLLSLDLWPRHRHSLSILRSFFWTSPAAPLYLLPRRSELPIV